VPKLEINGHAPDSAEIYRLAIANYGHFTTMQVRDGRVRGLALHMARLDDGNEAFFGARMDFAAEQRVRELIRHALAGAPAATVRVSMTPGPADAPDVVVAVSDPRPDVAGPAWRIQTRVYERDWPEQKHAATMALRVAQRHARRDGFDDALFVGRDGLVREGSVWNVAFWDGTQVVWPQAPVLRGVTMVLLQVAMSMNGLPWTQRPVAAAELPSFAAAAAVNAGFPGQPIASVDGVALAGDPTVLTDVLTLAWATVGWDEI
jgi:branched-subunit amino acid aminotransferase/4-amino-4-deoxychorismate lyase